MYHTLGYSQWYVIEVILPHHKQRSNESSDRAAASLGITSIDREGEKKQYEYQVTQYLSIISCNS